MLQSGGINVKCFPALVQEIVDLSRSETAGTIGVRCRRGDVRMAHDRLAHLEVVVQVGLTCRIATQLAPVCLCRKTTPLRAGVPKSSMTALCHVAFRSKLAGKAGCCAHPVDQAN